MTNETAVSVSDPLVELPALWRQYDELRRAWRPARAELAQLRLRVGEALAAEQDRFRALGPESGFVAWLRSQRLSVRTAYRLISAWRCPYKSRNFHNLAASNCLRDNPSPAPAPVCHLGPASVRFRLDARAREICRRALREIEAVSGTWSVPQIFTEMFLSFVPAEIRAEIRRQANACE